MNSMKAAGPKVASLVRFMVGIRIHLATWSPVHVFKVPGFSTRTKYMHLGREGEGEIRSKEIAFFPGTEGNLG